MAERLTRTAATDYPDGVEWYTWTRADGTAEEDGQCARCGSSVAWEDCWQCAGVGLSYHDCREDCCACRDPEPNVVCDWCFGKGGRYRCLSSRAYCEANPLPGREHVASTAREGGENG